MGIFLVSATLGRSFMENKLITAVAAVEGLHRRLLPGKTYVSIEQFDAMQDLLSSRPCLPITSSGSPADCGTSPASSKG